MKFFIKTVAAVMTLSLAFGAVPAYSAESTELSAMAAAKAETAQTSYMYTSAVSKITGTDKDISTSLKLFPQKGVSLNSSFTIELENGVFPEDIANRCVYDSGANTYDEVLDGIFSSYDNGNISDTNLARVLASCMLTSSPTDELPYNIEYISSNKIKVTLIYLPESFVNQSGIICHGIPYYNIPIIASAVSDANVYADIKFGMDAFETDEAYLCIGQSDNDVKHAERTRSNHYMYYGAVKTAVGDSFENYYYIRPTSAVPLGTEFYISLTNGKFKSDIATTGEYNAGNMTYDEVINEIDKYGYTNDRIIANVLFSCMSLSTDELPYKLEYINETCIKVSLAPLPEYAANESGIVSEGKPYYLIPIFGELTSGTAYISADSELTDVYTSSLAAAYSDDTYKENAKAVVLNGVNDEVLVKDSPITNVTLFMQPSAPINKYDSITVTIKNGTFDKSIEEEGAYKSASMTYDEIIAELEDLGDEYINRILVEALNFQTDQMPYKIEFINEKTIKVSLIPLSKRAVGISGVVSRGIPYYSIPLIAKANGTGNVSVTVDFDNTNGFRGNYFSGLIANAEGGPVVRYGAASAGSSENPDGEKLTAGDSAIVLQKVLNGSFKMPIEDVVDDYTAYLDVDLSGKVDAADSSTILQKVLNNSFVMPIEKQ